MTNKEVRKYFELMYFYEKRIISEKDRIEFIKLHNKYYALILNCEV